MRTSLKIALGLLGGGQTSWALTAPTPTLGAELLVDGDMEAAGTVAWTANSGAVLSKQTTDPHGGSRVLRVATAAGDSAAQARQDIITAGVPVRVGGYTRSDSTGQPIVYIGLNSAWTGTTSTAWQSVALSGIASSSIMMIGTSGIEMYTEWDDLTAKPVTNHLAGVNTGSNQHAVSAGITLAANYQAGVFAAADGATTPNNYVLAYLDRYDNKVHTLKYLSGSYNAELGVVAVSYSAGASLQAARSGNNLVVSYNGSTIATYTLTDAALLNGTHAGLFSTDASQVTFTEATARL